MSETIDLLILSDRYLPYSVGGAELSLHSVVSKIPKSYSVLICSIYPFEYKEEEYLYEGVKVRQLKPYAQFPFHFLSQDEYNLLSSLELDTIKSYENSFLSKVISNWQLGGEVSEIDKKFLLKHGIDKLIFESACTIQQLKEICDNYHIKTLHADNLRSIAFSKFIKADRKIFTIRDNRFHELDIKSDMSDCQINILIDNFEYRLSLLREADVVTTTSNFLFNNIKRVDPMLNCIKIPNPIDDIKYVSQIGKNTREKDGFNIVIIGMLTENKGQVQFIKALGKKLKKYPDIKVHFLGRGERIKKRIMELSKDFGILEQVFLHDYLSRDEVYEIIFSSQLVVLPTIWEEPFGRVPLEAALAKKAVVSFAVGGLKETIIDEETGFLIPKGEFEKMFEKILFLRENPQTRRYIGLNAYDHVRKTYGLDDIVKQYMHVWNLL